MPPLRVLMPPLRVLKPLPKLPLRAPSMQRMPMPQLLLLTVPLAASPLLAALITMAKPMAVGQPMVKLAPPVMDARWASASTPATRPT